MPPPELPPRKRKREEREDALERRPVKRTTNQKIWLGIAIVLPVTIMLAIGASLAISFISAIKETRDDVKKQIAKNSPERIDYNELYNLYRENKPAALNKYKGKLIEVNTSTANIIGGDEKKIQLGIIVDQSGLLFETGTFRVEAVFSFADDRNADLKTFKSGPFKRTIVGYIGDIDNLTLNREGLTILLINTTISK